MPSGATAQAELATRATVKEPFRLDIQGLRAIAVLFVVAYHAGLKPLSGGYVGVDVFFVISGFLITGQLLRMLDREGSIRFGNFYAKRARRILPAALLVAGLTTVASWIWMPPLLMKEVWHGAVATALYAPNMLFAYQGTNYLSESTPSVFQHYWSLGIEEQFYIFWPAILAVGFWIFRRNQRVLLAMVAALTLASFVLCVVGMDISQPWTFFSLPTRAWELGVGALVAFVVRSGWAWLKRPSTGLLAWIGLVSLLVIGFSYDSSTPFPGFYAALPVLATALLIVGGGAESRLSSGRLLGAGILQFIGKISYSLYLVHWPLQVIPQAFVGSGEPLPLLVRLLLGLASVPLAWLLFRWVEEPAMRYRPLAHGRPRNTFVVALAASGLVIALAFTAFTASNQIQLSTNQTASQKAIEVQPTGTPFVPSNLKPSLRLAFEDTAASYALGCHVSFDSTDASGCQVGTNAAAPLVVLFGDSHSSSWYPALEQLAKAGKIRLDSSTKNACPSVNIPTLHNGVAYKACQVWREAAVKRMTALHPDIVVLANYRNVQLVGGNGNFSARWQKGLESTIFAFGTSKTMVISDVPTQAGTPAVCLSMHLESTVRCDRDRVSALSTDIIEAERAAARSTGARYVDFVHYFCNATTCPVIFGDTLVYRDADHLTATFSRQMVTPLWKEIQATLHLK
ncbi:acyltransferase [Arthrobacter sp. SDTb3-6]|nr:acyltransferase family protein [Arthrobacter sp. SDTb3-6]NVM97836.1 acyltransferase [Arthrobacter sp. SDTb3-6]